MVNYAAAEHEETRRQLAQMSRRLYRFVTPFAIITVLLGAALVAQNLDYYLQATWFWLKFAAVLCLLVYHYYCGKLVSAMEAGTDQHSHVYFRVFNEIPVLFMFSIVILAVLKPF